MRDPLPLAWQRVLRQPGDDARSLSNEDLTQHLYETHFAGWRAPATSSGRASGDPSFVERIAVSLSDARGWEPGWEVLQREGDARFVHDGRMQLLITTSELHPAHARVGQRASILMPCLREGLVPGFLYAFSRAGSIDPRAPHLRIYLHVTPETGADFFARLFLSRATARLRFEAKMPNDPALFERRDTMVIYVPPADAAALLGHIKRWRREHPRGWRSATPFAAHAVAPGIAIAESPPFLDGEAQSFGLHRSGLLACAVQEARSAREREAHLIGLLRAEGIAPSRPYAQRLPESFWKRLLRE